MIRDNVSLVRAPVITPAQARDVVGGTGGGTGRAKGAELFRFVSEHRFSSCLELGFAHGVSTVYIAAALERTSGDRSQASTSPHRLT